MSLGRWDAALEHLGQAERLDPRSSRTPWLRGYALLWLRRYPEALQAYDRGLALAPGSASLLTGKVMVFLAQGDLAGARAVLDSAPKEVDPAALVALMTQYYELEWVLEDAQQTLLLRLTPADFDGDRGVWGLVFARTYALRGDQARARAYADSARRSFEEQLRAAPDNPDRHAFLGLAFAYLGRRRTAIREGQRAMALLPVTKDAYVGPTSSASLRGFIYSSASLGRRSTRSRRCSRCRTISRRGGFGSIPTSTPCDPIRGSSGCSRRTARIRRRAPRASEEWPAGEPLPRRDTVPPHKPCRICRTLTPLPCELRGSDRTSPHARARVPGGVWCQPAHWAVSSRFPHIRMDLWQRWSRTSPQTLARTRSRPSR